MLQTFTAWGYELLETPAVELLSTLELGVEPAIAVDTHVFRVSHRLGLADASTPDKVERQLFKVVPEQWLTRAHHWLILHGRYVCVARKPLCERCVIADLCKWPGKTVNA